jgi:hypothetical protein
MIEVQFVDGLTEFYNYETKTIQIEIPDTSEVYLFEVNLDESEIDPTTLTFINNTNIDLSELTLSLNNKKLVLQSSTSIAGVKLLISYTYLNRTPDFLYSVDYIEGILYFSKEQTKSIDIKYTTDQLLLEGKSAEQLKEGSDYNFVNNIVDIKNYDNSNISFVYDNKLNISKKISPILSDVKLNIILKDDLSL